MKNKTSQIRVTVPKWIADLKDWNNDTHLEITPLTEKKDNNITKDALIIIREVRKNG